MISKTNKPFLCYVVGRTSRAPGGKRQKKLQCKANRKYLKGTVTHHREPLSWQVQCHCSKGGDSLTHYFLCTITACRNRYGSNSLDEFLVKPKHPIQKDCYKCKKALIINLLYNHDWLAMISEKHTQVTKIANNSMQSNSFTYWNKMPF